MALSTDDDDNFFNHLANGHIKHNTELNVSKTLNYPLQSHQQRSNNIDNCNNNNSTFSEPFKSSYEYSIKRKWAYYIYLFSFLKKWLEEILH